MGDKIDAVRQLIACWERRDIDALLACLTDDVENYWHMVEGHEELWDNEHQRTIQQPFMQAFEFRGNLISHWRDYYEPENLAPPAEQATASPARQ